MLQETETEEAIGILSHFFIIGGISIGEGLGPLGIHCENSSCSLKVHLMANGQVWPCQV